MKRLILENTSRTFVRHFFPMACVVIVLVLGSISRNAMAETSCTNIPSAQFPGLQQCVAKVQIDTVIANPPVPQKMSLWCWAASLSMIFTLEGHPISQDNIVIQNFGTITNASGGSFVTFQGRLNRTYVDDDGNAFRSVSKLINTPDEAAAALDNDIPILYTTVNHATVQTSLTYQKAPGGPTVVKDATIWDPALQNGLRHLSLQLVQTYKAAWSIETHDVP